MCESRVLKPIVLYKMFALYKTRRKGRPQTTGLPFVFNFPTKTVPPIEKWVRWCHFLRLDGAATFARPNEIEALSASKHCNVYWNANSSLIIPVFANICFCERTPRIYTYTHTWKHQARCAQIHVLQEGWLIGRERFYWAGCVLLAACGALTERIIRL